jgi:hypothetical protein
MAVQDINPGRGGEESLMPQDRIAGFLRDHRITIVPSEIGDSIYTFTFFQASGNGSGNIRDLGEVTYDRQTSSLLPVGADDLRKRLQQPGFITEVVIPLCSLLIQESGDFYSERFGPIHDALDYIEDHNRF